MSSSTPHNLNQLPCIPGLELEEKIGEGGMSVVYRAVHRTLNRPVAVKLLHSSFEEGITSGTFLRESRLMASLAHPHVVAIYDAGQVDGRNYLLMEYMAGGSLRSRMRPGQPWPLAAALPLLDSVAQALSHIHEHGVLHLDLKPENILYTSSGEVKITDFGLSLPNVDAKMILEGKAFRGTIDYSAPEHRSGLSLDSRYDVFSLATLAYELLTGRHPGRVYVPASHRNSRLPASLDDVLRRGLARDPNDRYASVVEFRKGLIDAGRAIPKRFPLRPIAIFAALAIFVLAFVALYNWKFAEQKRNELTDSGPETVPPHAIPSPSSEKPDRIVVLYDSLNQPLLGMGEDDKEFAHLSAGVIERIQVDNPPRSIPSEFPFPVWPTPRPALMIHSPQAWGFVHPLLDRSLSQRVLRNWPELIRMTVPSETSLIKAGGFDGDCLTIDASGKLWRIGDVSDWSTNREIILDRPRDQPQNPSLLLTNSDPSHGSDLLSCFQSIPSAPAPSSIIAIRYRARAESGQPHLQICLGLPVVVPADDNGEAATRVRTNSRLLPPEPSDNLPNRWWYGAPKWITPSNSWQTYLVIYDLPPFPSRVTHRNLVVETIGIGQVRVDDIELFVCQLGNKP